MNTIDYIKKENVKKVIKKSLYDKGYDLSDDELGQLRIELELKGAEKTTINLDTLFSYESIIDKTLKEKV